MTVILHFLAKVLLGFVGWYIFSSQGVLPDQLMNPVYKYYHLAEDFQIYYEEKELPAGCYGKYVNTGENANLSVCNISPLGKNNENTFAYTAGNKTYFALNEKLFLTEKEDMSYNEIYSKLISPISGMAKVEDELFFLGDGEVFNRTLHYTDKVNNVISGWYDKYVKNASFKEISTNCSNLLRIQDNMKISTDEFSFLVYCQSMGILVSYKDGTGIFIDRKENGYDIYKSSEDSGPEYFATIPCSTGYFYADGGLYYSSENVLRFIDLTDGHKEKVFEAQDKIISLNYFFSPVREAEKNHERYKGEETLRCYAILTEKEIIYLNDYIHIPYSHKIGKTDLYEKCEGLYMTAYPYKGFLVYDSEIGNYMKQYERGGN